MDYEEIKDEHHNQYIQDIVIFIKNNTENKKISFFIDTIMQSNKDEYKLLCNALYMFITPQGGGVLNSELNFKKFLENARLQEQKRRAEKAAQEAEEEEAKLTTINSKAQAESPIANILIEKLNQIKYPIKIPHKNKLLIDEQFELKKTSKDIKYKYYLSFYIIDAINNITVSSSGS